MIDQSDVKGRIVAAALRLAAERPWNDVTLRDMAEAAGASLGDLRGVVPSKAAVLTLFNKAIDDDVLRKSPRPSPGQPERDRLFEVMMARFDAMQPYRPAIRSILKSPTADGRLLWSLVRSQHWMLTAAGLETEGTLGRARIAGLASVYGSAFRTWLDDDDAGLARTMAILDRRLRAGERSMQGLEGLCNGLSRMRDTVSEGMSRRRSAVDQRSQTSSAYGSQSDGGVGSSGGFGSTPTF
jgi:ubiquinone biosynthesis protein COQ9